MSEPQHSQQSSNGIAVRAAEVSDADALAVIYDDLLRSYGHEPDVDHTPRFITQLLQLQWVRFFVATDATGRLLGFIGCSLTYSAVSQRLALTINDLFVLVPQRRRGVASALLAVAERYARSNGLAKLFVEAATDATVVIRLYERAGFVKLPHLTLKKELGHGV